MFLISNYIYIRVPLLNISVVVLSIFKWASIVSGNDVDELIFLSGQSFFYSISITGSFC